MAENKNVSGATVELLEKYSQLLNDAPETRAVLAQDETIVSFLLDTLAQFDDQKTIRMTLEIMLDLISCAGNKTKSVLCNSKFKDTLEKLVGKFKPDANITFICDSIVDQLFPEHRAAIKAAAAINTTNRSRAPRFLPSASRQQTKTLVFQSSAFADPDVKRAVEQRLIKVKGVVSIYFESTTKICRCIIRVWTSILPQTIADTILATERLSSLHHVSKDEFGDEIMFLYGSDGKEDEKKMRPPEKSTLPLPGYLDENDDLIFGVVLGDRALTKYGETDNKKGGGWLSGVSSFFSKTLYW